MTSNHRSQILTFPDPLEAKTQACDLKLPPAATVSDSDYVTGDAENRDCA